MLKNIIITSLRNFIRNRTFSLINLVGLAVSMSLGMLILTIVQEQFSYDDFHADRDRIYRVNTLVNHAEWGTIDFASTPIAVGGAFQDNYSLTENIVQVNREFYGDATFGDVQVPVTGLLVNQSFLHVFNFPLHQGDAASALSQPNSLVLTQAAAKKIFGTVDAVGQTLSMPAHGTFTVTGVLEPFGNTHFDFEVLASLSTVTGKKSSDISHDWTAFFNNYVYLKLKPGQTASEAEQALAQLNKRYGQGLASNGRSIAYTFYLQPLTKITPGPELSGQMGKGLPTFFLAFLGVLAGVVLLMSIFNFTNLTIAKSLTRAREIGVRKVAGASRSQVFGQLIGEAMVFSMIALAFAYVLFQFLKIGFMNLSLQQDFFMTLQESMPLYGLFILFALGVGLLAGLLPAIYLSAFKPSRVLKDVQNVKVYGKLTLRKALIVTQFTLLVVFVIVTQVVYRQVNFMVNADYGIDQAHTIQLALRGVPIEKIEHEVTGLPGVVRVGGASHRIGTMDGTSGNYRRNQRDEPFTMHEFTVDQDFVQNLSPQFIVGRNFNAAEGSAQEGQVIINETALTALGYTNPSDAIDQTIHSGDDSVALQIIGVMKDFHFRPMINRIGPLAFRYDPKKIQYLSVKVEPAKQAELLQSLAVIWKRHDPIHPAQLEMMDSTIDNAYRDAGMHDVIVIIGYITLLIGSLACLGMLGMAMYASRTRVKEVGIRKVMGASVKQMMFMLLKSYIILIGISMLIGVPASLLLGNLFLDDFPYRIDITPVLIGSSIAAIAALGLLTVWSQTIWVAMSNPVKWLRHE